MCIRDRFRVYQGTMTHDTQVMNTRTHHKERVGQLLVPHGGKDVGHADEFGPGDIGAVAKLKETHAGDWLAARERVGARLEHVGEHLALGVGLELEALLDRDPLVLGGRREVVDDRVQ